MKTKVKEVVMYEAEDGVMYKTKEAAEAANLVLEGTKNAMIELDRLMKCYTSRYFNSVEVYDISNFIIENRKEIIKFLNF